METPIVKIAEGQLRGRLMSDYDGGRIYAFLGIPFAKQPVGELRFKAPQPAEPWEGVKDATKNGSKCIQNDILINVIEGSEDCLHLNVFTKELPLENNFNLKPVMVWIHGGAFQHGANTSENYGPEYLLTQDIVLVCINYRLGVFGFLSLEDPSFDIPGNAGLKDQQLALQWIQRNIRSFNGDPNNVTIFGESAGSFSVHYHILSPSSKGLFHKAILQSGAALNKWHSDHKLSLVEFAKFAGKEAESESDALDFLMNIPVEELYDAQAKYVAFVGRGLPLAPVVEKPNESAVLTESPLEIITSGKFNKVPVIFGFTSHEGILMEIDNRRKRSKGIELPDGAPNILMLLPKKIRETAGSEIVKQLSEKITQVYFTGENAKYNFLLPSDAHFVVGILASAKLHAKFRDTPVYLYRMNLDDDLNLFKKLAGMDDIPGMSHADDLGYLFTHSKLPLPQKGSSAEAAMRKIVKLWTNFAKFDNPTPDENELKLMWKPLEEHTVHFLDIGPEIQLQTDPESDRMKLWKEILMLEAVL